MADVRRRRREYWAGLAAVLTAAVVTVLGLWPVPRGTDGTVEAILNDRPLVGLLRLAVLAIALYAIASVPALMWVRAGQKVSAPPAWSRMIPAWDVTLALAEARRNVDALERHNNHLEDTLDELWELVDVETTPN